MIPRQFPCKPVWKNWDTVNENAKEPDVTKHKDPYASNPAITAEFWNFTGWKCGRNAAIAERMGDVKWYNFKAADNARVDLEMTFPHYYGENKAIIDKALVIGKSNNVNPTGDDLINWVSPRGVEMASEEYFNVKNVRFFNFDFNDAAAIGTCSHCTQPESSGGFTSRTEKLWFDEATVPRRITFNFPGKGILYDIDGTLTDKGPGSWAAPYFKHNEWAGCENLSDTKYRGHICDSSV